jgi:hypothetical protein
MMADLMVGLRERILVEKRVDMMVGRKAQKSVEPTVLLKVENLVY